jgi:hypothetical protein
VATVIGLEFGVVSVCVCGGGGSTGREDATSARCGRWGRVCGEEEEGDAERSGMVGGGRGWRGPKKMQPQPVQSLIKEGMQVCNELTQQQGHSN